MEQELVTALEKQAAHELFAAQTYLSLAYWSDVHHWSGFAEFFHLQVEEEREHAEKILQFLAERDVMPSLLAIPAARNSFDSLLAVAQAVYDLERANTAGIHSAYEVALRTKDYSAQVMLHWFISEQVEEEAWSEKLLAKVREANCSGGLSTLDRHLIKELRPRSDE